MSAPLGFQEYCEWLLWIGFLSRQSVLAIR